MPIGLTSEQIVKIFLDAFIKRQSELETERITADLGVNPLMAKLQTELQAKYPTIDIDQFTTVIVVITAFADTIARNNEELSKAIPSSDLPKL